MLANVQVTVTRFLSEGETKRVSAPFVEATGLPEGERSTVAQANKQRGSRMNTGTFFIFLSFLSCLKLGSSSLKKQLSCHHSVILASDYVYSIFQGTDFQTKINVEHFLTPALRFFGP
jgi:hypothetical protein